METNWNQDARAQGMDPEKLKILNDFAEKVKNTPKSQLMQTFMALNMEIKQKNIRFSDKETDILVSILTKNMSEAERRKVDTLKMLSKKLAGHH